MALPDCGTKITKCECLSFPYGLSAWFYLHIPYSSLIPETFGYNNGWSRESDPLSDPEGRGVSIKCQSKYSRGPPFTRIPITYSTYYCLSGSIIHGCRVKFNHTVWNHLLDKHRRYESFGFIRACHIAALVFILLLLHNSISPVMGIAMRFVRVLDPGSPSLWRSPTSICVDLISPHLKRKRPKAHRQSLEYDNSPGVLDYVVFSRQMWRR